MSVWEKLTFFLMGYKDAVLISLLWRVPYFLFLIYSLCCEKKRRRIFRFGARRPLKRHSDGIGVVRELSRMHGLSDVRLVHICGTYADQFSHTANEIRLSNSSAEVSSVSAAASAAYQFAHMLLYRERNSSYMRYIKMQSIDDVCCWINVTLFVISLFINNVIILYLGPAVFMITLISSVAGIRMENAAGTRAKELMAQLDIVADQDRVFAEAVIREESYCEKINLFTKFAKLSYIVGPRIPVPW